MTPVLLPGLDGTGDLFAPFLAAAPQGLHPVVVDYPTGEGSVAVLKQRVLERLVHNCVVIAESFSGPIAVHIASDPRVRALVLCNSFISSPVSPALRHLVLAPMFGLPLPGLIIRRLLLGPNVDPSLIDLARSAIRRVPMTVMAQRLRQTLQSDGREAARSLARPILYLRGINDNLLSECSWRDLHATRPDAQIVRIGGPHLLLQASPRECWQAILHFIAETGDTKNENKVPIGFARRSDGC